MTPSAERLIRGRRFRASDPPVIDESNVPSKCLSFTIAADWGHFRRVDRTVTKQTYPLPPRTTVAGILASIVGVGRDDYYEIFGPDVSAISIELQDPVRTMPMASLGLSTDPEATFERAGGTGRKTVQVKYPDSTAPRQRHSYHYLVNPVYRIDVAVEHADFYGTLRQRLQTGTSFYPPTMGLSELLASIEWHGEYEPTPVTEDSPVSVDSALPDAVESIVPQRGQSYTVERVPGYMTAESGGRKTTTVLDYAFRKDAGAIKATRDELSPVSVDDRVLVFE